MFPRNTARRLVIVAPTVVALFALPAAAQAATISWADEVVTLTAAPGEANNIEGPDLSVGRDAWTELGSATLTAGPGCTQRAAKTVECPYGELQAQLGDMDDRLVVDLDTAGETIFAGPGDDFVIGSSAVDPSFIYGEDGDDRLFGTNNGQLTHTYGGPGNDTQGGCEMWCDHHGGPGDDTISGGTFYEGPSTLAGDDGNDTITVDGIVEVTGGPGDDHVRVGEAEGSIDAGAGDDIVSGEWWYAGTMHGGPGDDQLEGDGSVYGDAGHDTLEGSDEDGDGMLFGGDGDDRLDGRGGNDALKGGPGNDTADFSTRTAPVVARLHGTGGVQGERDTLARDIENLTGGPQADTLIGSWRANVLTGGGGADWILGGDGADTVDGGPGSDQLNGGEGRDNVLGGPDDDRLLLVDEAADTAQCGPGTDEAQFDPGVDTIAADCETQQGAQTASRFTGRAKAFNAATHDRVFLAGADDRSKRHVPFELPCEAGDPADLRVTWGPSGTTAHTFRLTSVTDVTCGTTRSVGTGTGTYDGDPATIVWDVRDLGSDDKAGVVVYDDQGRRVLDLWTRRIVGGSIRALPATD